MSILAWLAGLFLISIASAVCLTIIIIYTDPYTAGWSVLALFYAALFMTAASCLSLIGWLVRRLSRLRRAPMSLTQAEYQLKISFRQGLLLAAILVTAFILQSYRVLNWWNIIILLILVVLAEWGLSRR